MAKKKVSDSIEDTAIYARYSSHAQNDDSIEQQVAECQSYAAANNLRVIEVYADRAMTGRNDKRPEFQRMMRAAESRKFQVVLSYKSNRIARNMLHALAYEDKLAKFGVRVVYAKEEFGNSAAGRFALRNMMNVNQFYSENMAEDIRRGLLDSAMQCHVIGAIPLGYRKGTDSKYEINEQTAPIVREIFKRVANGEAYTSIADDLNARGITTKLGKPWNKNSFHCMLTNERYIGVYQYDDVRIEGGIPPIIDEELFYMVKKATKIKATAVSGRRRENGEYLLTGKLFCGYCKSPMIGISGTSKTGELHYYYICQKKRIEHTCKKANVRRDRIELLIAEALKAYVLQPDMIEWIADTTMLYSKKMREENSELDYLEAKLAESKKISDNLLKALEAGVFNEFTQGRMVALSSEQKELNDRIKEERALLPDITRDKVIYWLHSFKDGNVESQEYREKLFDAFLLAVYLYDDHIKIVFSGDDKRPIEISANIVEDEDTADDTSCVRIALNESHHNLSENASFQTNFLSLWGCLLVKAALFLSLTLYPTVFPTFWPLGSSSFGVVRSASLPSLYS